jgi:hypothetical protein
MERLKDEGEVPSKAIISAWPASCAHLFRPLVIFEALLESAWCGQYSGLLRESQWTSSRSLRSGLLFEPATVSITFCPVRLLGKAHPEQPCLGILMMMIDIISPYTQQACIPLVVCVRFLRPSAFLPSHVPPRCYRNSLRIALHGVGVEHLEFQPFFEGRRHPSSEVAKSSE